MQIVKPNPPPTVPPPRRKRLFCIWCSADFEAEDVKSDVCPQCGKSGLMEEDA